MNKIIKERLYLKVNNAIDSLESRDINGTLLILESLRREQVKDNQKSELIGDLIACETVMEEIWKFHPHNPKKKDVVKEYKILQQVSEDLKSELENLN